jgi:hypothetical protein
MQIKMRVTGDKRLRAALRGMGRNVPRRVQDEMVAVGNDMRNFMIKKMKVTPRANWFYMRGGKRHFPSKPGEFPARDTGELVGHIVVDDRRRAVEVGAQVGAPHGKILEEGSADMKARPWVEPTAEAFEDEFRDRMYDAIRRSMK